MRNNPSDLLRTIVISSLLILSCRGEPAGCSRYRSLGWCQQSHIKSACPISCSANGGSPSATWSNWTTWSVCLVTCGSGTQSRTRTCSVAGQCSGSASQSRSCSKPPCSAGSATWSNWTTWSGCLVTCGSGTQSRTRTCSVAGQCPGSLSESRSCSKPPCSTGENPSCSRYKNWCSQTHIKNSCPITCAEGSSSASWRNWGLWSYCTPTCGGGSQTRSRTCSISGQCTGSSSETRQCNTQSCPGIWGKWSDWTPCSVTCGPGEQKRDRTCSAGGCTGESSQSRVCNETPCSSGWLPWEMWGLCDKACGPGVRRRLRVCKTNHQCSGSSTSTESCNLRSCTYESAYTQCSRTCGDGTQQKLQEGEYVTQHCKLRDCPHVACVGDFENRHENPAECCKKTKTCYRPAVEQRKLFYRIIGGSNSELGDWPWMVFIQQPAGACGGALISSKFILTAAHCLYLSSGKPVAAKDIIVRIGLVYLDTPGLKSYSIINVFIYPHYKFPDNDIAILELEDHVQFNHQIQPLCLPHGEVVPDDTICVVMGWGISILGVKQITKILQNVPIKVFNPEVCVDRYRSGYHSSVVSHLKRRRGYICAGDLVEQKDSCNGDSGSPLACQRCDNCGWFAAGVVSYGPNPCANKKDPGIYTSVVHYQEWIYHVTGIQKQHFSC